MKVWWFVFALLVGQCLVIGGALLRGESGEYHGVPHDVHEAMAVGGSPERHANLFLPGAVYGTLQIVLFVTLLTLGLRSSLTAQRRRLAVAALAFPGGLYLGTFFLIWWLYAGEMRGESTLLFSFPRSTLVMLLIFWPLPVLMIAVYALRFRDWICEPAEDES